jgi:hypothetical protein
MIATDNFVFLHLHKSGGTFVNEWLLRFFPGAKVLGYHLPRDLVPATMACVPLIGLVRNPWSYYVSWYAFQSGLPRQNALFQTLSDGGSLGFSGTIGNMLRLGGDDVLLDRVVAALPNSHAGRGLNLPGPKLARISNTGLGFYSFLYRYMYGVDSAVRVARMEAMRQELAALVLDTGATISPAAYAYLERAPATNTSVHQDYGSYYDAALRARVAEADADIIDAFDYRFGS